MPAHEKPTHKGDDPVKLWQYRSNRDAVGGTGRQWTRRVVSPAAPKARKARRSKSSSSRPWKKIIKRGLLAFVALLIVLAGWYVLTAGRGKFSLASLLGSATIVAFGHGVQLAGQSSGRTNILVYGMTEDGLRTDSIILVSYYWAQKKIVTINIPRDLYGYDGYENDKMGEEYAYAVNREPKNLTYPDQYVANQISKEYKIPINYWVQFAMTGEVDFVNAIGGVSIDVPDSFTDCQYPTWNYSGYVRPCPSFSAGEQHMSGSQALIFSRSRHSLQNNEGSDFARSRRQALVIQAVMSKLKSMGIVGNLAEVSHYLNILGSNVTTNMSTDQMVSFATALKNVNPQTDYEKAAWEAGNGFLCDSSTSSGEYILLYGQEGGCVLNNGGVGTGGYHNNQQRQLAVYFIQHLLASGGQSPAAFVQSADRALGFSGNSGNVGAGNDSQNGTP